jgi:hypothetical protein
MGSAYRAFVKALFKLMVERNNCSKILWLSIRKSNWLLEFLYYYDVIFKTIFLTQITDEKDREKERSF